MNRRTFVKATSGSALALLAGGRGRGQDEAAVVPVEFLHGYTHRLTMERGLKLHCLVPRLAEGLFGEYEYAGFLTARLGNGPWMFGGDQPPEHVVAPETLQDLKQGAFTIRRRTHAWEIEQTAQWIAMYPGVWTSARVHSDAEAPIIGGLVGWTWAERTLPTKWLIDGQALKRAEGGGLEFPQSCRWVAYQDEHGPFWGVLAFEEPSPSVWADDDGVYWEWGRAGRGVPFETPKMAYALLPGPAPVADVEGVAEMMLPAPSGFRAVVMPGEAPTWLVIADGATAGPVPPALAPRYLVRDGVASVPAASGEVLLVQGTGYSLDLPVPPEIDRPLPQVKAEGAVAEQIATHVADVLDHRLPDGRFGFSQGRTFYDGITCAALAQVLPVLGQSLRDQAAGAIRGCLDALCEQHVRSGAYDLLVPPEQDTFVRSVIDYPEITATLLYAMLVYSLNADREYPGQHRDLIELHAKQIGEMTSPCGTAWARADTEHCHVIAESAIGGYLAWASLYHLGELVSAEWAAECRARAALAWTAYRELFAWRPDYGESGVVSGWSNWRGEILSEPAWAFVQSTWFSFVPFLPVETEDRYGIWRCLREQPWWEWTGELGSRQRAYDYCNALALAGGGFGEEVREHWADINTRPFWWDYFDATPVLAIAALPQLTALGVLL